MPKVVVYTDDGVEVWKSPATAYSLRSAKCPTNTIGSSLIAGLRRAVEDAEAIEKKLDPERTSERVMREIDTAPPEVTRCPNCGSEKHPAEKEVGGILYWNCRDCLFSTWDRDEYQPQPEEKRWIVEGEDGPMYPVCSVCGTPIVRSARFRNPKAGDPGQDDYRCPDHPGARGEWRRVEATDEEIERSFDAYR